MKTPTQRETLSDDLDIRVGSHRRQASGSKKSGDRVSDRDRKYPLLRRTPSASEIREASLKKKISFSKVSGIEEG